MLGLKLIRTSEMGPWWQHDNIQSPGKVLFHGQPIEYDTISWYGCYWIKYEHENQPNYNGMQSILLWSQLNKGIH